MNATLRQYMSREGHRRSIPGGSNASYVRSAIRLGPGMFPFTPCVSRSPIKTTIPESDHVRTLRLVAPHMTEAH
jgi:hypothetical protein